MLVGLFRTALLTKTLTLEDYGRLLIVINFFPFLNMFFGVRLQALIYRFYPEFKRKKQNTYIQGMIIFSMLLSVFYGILLAGTSFFLSDWISIFFYDDPCLAPLFQLFIVVAFLQPFQEVTSSILRLHDKFACIVIPQVISAILSLILLILYIGSTESYSLIYVIFISAFELMLGPIISFIITVKILWHYIILKNSVKALKSLLRIRSKLLSILFQTNLIGYIKIASEDGGFFLLGILAGHSEVAIYGIARQLIKPLKIIERNVNITLMPEVTLLRAENNITKLYRLVAKYSKISFFLGAFICAACLLLAKPAILLLTKPEYLDALPVFYLLLFSIYLTFSSLIFFPLALVLDRLKQRNYVVSIRFIYLGIACMFGLNGFLLALAHTVGVITVRLLHDLPLYNILKRKAAMALNKTS